jgi:hypothetical protein
MTNYIYNAHGQAVGFFLGYVAEFQPFASAKPAPRRAILCGSLIIQSALFRRLEASEIHHEEENEPYVISSSSAQA